MRKLSTLPSFQAIENARQLPGSKQLAEIRASERTKHYNLKLKERRD